MNKSKINIHSSNGLEKKSAREMVMLVIPIAVVAVMLTLAISLTSATTVLGQANSTTQPQQQSSSSSANTSDKSGTITSVQTDAQGKWNLSGNWTLTGINSGSPTFNAHFNMAKLDGSAKHQHTISDFKITGSPITNSSATTYKGTSTITMKEKPANNVPVSIIISNNGNFSIMVDPKATDNHFGNTPIMGKVTA
jgi:hypothetical protein